MSSIPTGCPLIPEVRAVVLCDLVDSRGGDSRTLPRLWPVLDLLHLHGPRLHIKKRLAILHPDRAVAAIRGEEPAEVSGDLRLKVEDLLDRVVPRPAERLE